MGAFSLSDFSGDAAAEFEKKFGEFQAEADKDTAEFDKAVQGLKGGITLVRRLKRAQIRDIRLKKREGKEERRLSDLVKVIEDSIKTCYTFVMRIKADEAIDVDSLNEDQKQRFYSELTKHIKDFEDSQKKIDAAVSDAIEELKTIYGEEKLEIAMEAAKDKIEEEGLNQLKQVQQRLAGVQAHFNSFFNREAA